MIAIQSPLENDVEELQGIVRIYRNTPNTNSWIQIGSNIVGKKSFNAGYSYDFTSFLPTSISLNFDGSIVAIGASGNDENGENSGYVRIFRNINNIWTQIGNNIVGESAGDLSGFSISLNSDGSIVAIGASRNDGNGGNSGHARIFKNINSVWTQIGEDINGEESKDQSGSVVSLNSDGSVIAISAIRNDGNGGNSGHVRVYKNNNDTWIQLGNDIDGETSNEFSGNAISLNSDGTILAISTSLGNYNGFNSGHVKIYQNTNGTWSQIDNTIVGQSTGDYSGVSISLSSDGTFIAIGASNNDDNGENSGHVKIYQNTNGSWSQIGNTIVGQSTGDYSGVSVSLSDDGTIVSIGAKSNSVNGILSDDVKIYKNINNVWVEKGNINDGNLIGEELGSSISLNSDGTIIAIGTNHNDSNGSYSGNVKIYENTNNVWTQIGNDINGENNEDYSGSSISLNTDGTIIAIGAFGNDGNGLRSGHVRVFKNINNVWTQIGNDINGEAEQINSGSSVSVNSDGTIIAIGSPNNTPSSLNHIKVYRNINDIWTQIGSKIEGLGTGEYFGDVVSLSSDGNIVAVGAKWNSDLGNYFGKVRIYKNENNTWVQIGSDLNGQNEREYFGESVSLSSDGNIVAVGGSGNNKNNSNSGNVKIFKNVNDTWIQIGSDILGEKERDYFGESVSLSSDGSIIAIGAPSNNGTSPILLSDFESGYVKVYQNINEVWELKATIRGDFSGDDFGRAVSLSSNGNILGISSPFKDINSFNEGLVRVYDLSSVLSIEKNKISDFKIYPNPASKQIKIELNNSELLRVSVFNNLGQLIKSSKKTTINTIKLESGIYFLQVETNLGKTTKKLVIE